MKLTLLLVGTVATTAAAVSISSEDQPTLLRGMITSKLTTPSDEEFKEMLFDRYDLLAMAEGSEPIKMTIPKEENQSMATGPKGVEEDGTNDDDANEEDVISTEDSLLQSSLSGEPIPEENFLDAVDGVVPEDMNEELLQVKGIKNWCRKAQMHWGDMDGDGDLDAICTTSKGHVWVGFQDSPGNFRSTYHGLGWCSHSGSKIQFADVNGDGKIDKICDDTRGHHWVMISDGKTFTKWGTGYASGYQYGGWCGHAGSATQYADINGDGKADMLCDDTRGNHWARLSTGRSRNWIDWGLQLTRWCGHGGAYTQYADVNGDKMADMHCDDTRGNHWIILATGRSGRYTNWGYQASTRNWCAQKGGRTSWADVSGDGKADMICDDLHGRHWIRVSTGRDDGYVDWGYQFGGWCTNARTSWNKSYNKDNKADIFCDSIWGHHWVRVSIGNRAYSRTYLL